MTIFVKREPPGAISDEAIARSTRAAISSRGWIDIGDARIEQIEGYGHTAEIDDSREWNAMARPLNKFVAKARDDISLGPNRDRLTAARRSLVKLAAMALALIDRIDRYIDALDAPEEETEGGQSQ